MRVFILQFLLLITALPALGLDVISQWVLPSRFQHPSTRGPQERTRPVVLGDVIYFANLDGRVAAMHRKDGYILWEYRMQGAVDGALAYGRSRLYVGDTSGNLVALNARDGSVAWSFKVEAEWLSPPAVDIGRIFAASSSDELYAFSEVTGSELWHFSHRGDEKMTIRGIAGPSIFRTEDGRVQVYQGFSDGSLIALTGEKGQTLWSRRLKSRERFYDVDTTPFVDERSVIAATYDGKLYSLERVSGTVQWVLPVGSYGGFLVDSSSVFVSGVDRNIYGVDRDTGEERWKTPYESGVALAPVRVGENWLMVPTSSDPAYLLELRSGKIVWQQQLGVGTLSSAVSIENWFYILGNYGHLFSFELKPEIRDRKGPETVLTPSAIYRNRAPIHVHSAVSS